MVITDTHAQEVLVDLVKNFLNRKGGVVKLVFTTTYPGFHVESNIRSTLEEILTKFVVASGNVHMHLADNCGVDTVLRSVLQVRDDVSILMAMDTIAMALCGNKTAPCVHKTVLISIQLTGQEAAEADKAQALTELQVCYQPSYVGRYLSLSN